VPEIEYVTTAAHAEAHNGLLYLTGAGWTDIARPVDPLGNPAPVAVGIGVSIIVGWTEANVSFAFRLVVEDEDQHRPPLVEANGNIEQGRPAGVAPGSDLRSVLALNGIVVFPAAGGYRITATVGDAAKSVSFRVRDAGAPQSGSGPTSIPPLG
jgi:hypothetical protein